MKKILIIEDEESITEFLELELKHEGYEVEVAHSGRLGLEKALERDYDLILLDLMLPELSGVEVCRRVTSVKDTPIIMLTARDSVMDRVMGLDNGAEDYIPKPFSIEELFARMRVVFRRKEKTENQFDHKISFKDIELDTISRTVKKSNENIELTKREYDLLLFFLQNINRVLTREIIMDRIWGYDYYGETNVVDVYVRHLRSKINLESENYIDTIRGVGYVMR
ncbi:response regulator transcription factor [Priestia koreensis]|uniref:PhoB family transcriptional regulator n=1 Tax=Priestia koreensis TaxID=284581 RepID=A0A0M0KNM9_9BACI|nr:response regulator transcription factor [Priestia koreensis]KOO40420.1 PhoB family transcriptional regulator [Priestia koreensis]